MNKGYVIKLSVKLKADLSLRYFHDSDIQDHMAYIRLGTCIQVYFFSIKLIDWDKEREV